MGNSKVIFGNETLIDLTGDTVTPDTLLAGTTAHNRSGEQIVGTATVPEELDDLTDVTLTSPAEGDLLQYNSTSGEWENSDEIPQELAAMQENGAYNRAACTFPSQVVTGVTFTQNTDGTVNINGTNTGSGSAGDPSNYFTLKAGTYKTICGGDSTNNYTVQIIKRSPLSVLVSATYYERTFTLTEDTEVYCNITVPVGRQVNNKICKFMIYDARLVNPPYQPFTMTNMELTDALAYEDITSEITIDSTRATYSAFYACRYGKVVQLTFTGLQKISAKNQISVFPVKYAPALPQVQFMMVNNTNTTTGILYATTNGVNGGLAFTNATPQNVEFLATMTWITK